MALSAPGAAEHGQMAPGAVEAVRPAGVVLALAAFGSGLIHLALAARAEPLFLAALIIAGAVELALATHTLAARHTRVPPAALAVFLAPLMGWAVAIVAEPAAAATSLTAWPMLTASVLDVTAAGIITGMHRRRYEAPQATAPRTTRFIVTLLVGSAVLSVITVPALAATQTGQSANQAPMQMGDMQHMHMP